MLGFKRNGTRGEAGARHKRAGMLWLFSWVALGGLVLSVPTIRTKESGRGPSPGAEPSASPQKALTHRAKNIEEIVPGDLVMAEDESTGKFVPKRVVQVFRIRADHLRLVSIRSADGKRAQELKTTNEHPFFVEGEGWIAANRLRPGQKVVQSDGRLGTVLSSTHEPHPEGVPVFNFEVEDVHNYFVAQDLASLPILVHNACSNPGRAGKQARLRELANDPNVSSADRGWIQQELNAIERGQRTTIRVPPGKNLAHERGFEAKYGYGYDHSNLQDIDLHRLQHRIEGY